MRCTIDKKGYVDWVRQSIKNFRGSSAFDDIVFEVVLTSVHTSHEEICFQIVGVNSQASIWSVPKRFLNIYKDGEGQKTAPSILSLRAMVMTEVTLMVEQGDSFSMTGIMYRLNEIYPEYAFWYIQVQAIVSKVMADYIGSTYMASRYPVYYENNQQKSLILFEPIPFEEGG